MNDATPLKTQTGSPAVAFQTSKPERTAYGVYFFGQSIIYMLLLNFHQIFLTDQGIRAAAVATIFLVAKVWDAVNDPILGVIIDRSKPKRGKFLPWIRWSIIPIAITTVLIFAMPASISLEMKIVWAIVAYLLWDLTYTLTDAPIFALTTAMTENIQERTVIISIGRVGGMIGTITIALSIPLLYPKIGWLATALAVSVIGVIAKYPVTNLAQERIISRKENAPSLGDIWKYLKGNKYLLVFYASMVVYSLTNTVLTLTPYFAVNNLGNPQAATTLLGITILPMLLLAAFTPALTKRFGKFNLYVFSIVFFIVFSVVIYFVGYKNYPLFILVLVLRNLGAALTGILTFMFTPDCVEYGTFKTGERAEGITFSLQTFATKLMNGLSAAIALAGLAHFGFVEGAGAIQTSETLNGIWFMYSIFPVIGAVLALPLLRMFKLRDDNVQVMAKANNGEITREEAFKLLPKEFHFRLV